MAWKFQNWYETILRAVMAANCEFKEQTSYLASCAEEGI